jgi:hypothetical protein
MTTGNHRGDCTLAMVCVLPSFYFRVKKPPLAWGGFFCANAKNSCVIFGIFFGNPSPLAIGDFFAGKDHPKKA